MAEPFGSFGAIDLLQQVGGDPDLAGSVLARAAHAERMQDRADEREAEARRARVADNAEIRAIQNRMMGDPLGHIRSAQMRAADLDSEVADLRARLDKAVARQTANREQLTYWAELGMLAEESSSRSVAPDPLEIASMRAADALREAHEGRMLVERARRQVRQRSR